MRDNKYLISEDKKFVCWFDESQGAIFLYCSEVIYSKFLKKPKLEYPNVVECMVPQSKWGLDDFIQLLDKDEDEIKQEIKKKLVDRGIIKGKYPELVRRLDKRYIVK